MANSKWRVLDIKKNRVLAEGSTWGLGAITGPTNATGEHIGPVIDATWLKTHVHRLATKRNYYDSQVAEKVPQGTKWRKWIEDWSRSQEIGCKFFFAKYSWFREYRIELEVNETKM